MKRITWIALASLVLMTAAHAASFDCSKAGTSIEKMICADTELYKLDDDLAKKFRRVLEQSTDRQRTVQEQRQWLKDVRNACVAAICLREEYQRRIDALPVVQEDTARATPQNVAAKSSPANLAGISDFDQVLLDAISHEDIAAIHQAIQKGARVNSDGKELKPGLPPLILAILVNNPESVDVLLKAGADPNLVQNSQYPLYQAVNADTRILKLVLDAKANPNTPVFLGYTPLQRAASCKRQTYEELSKNGSYKGNFPDCEMSIQLLLNAGASIELPGFHKNTPLIEAVYWNNLNSAKILLVAGANIEAISAVQDTPLKTALRNYAEEQYSLRQKRTYINGHVLPMVELLLKNGAIVNVKFEGRHDEFDDAKYTMGNFAGNTPLTLAARYGWIDLARLLLQNHADPTLVRSDGMTPAEIAQQHGHKEIAMLIKQSVQLKPTNK